MRDDHSRRRSPITKIVPVHDLQIQMEIHDNLTDLTDELTYHGCLDLMRIDLCEGVQIDVTEAHRNLALVRHFIP